MSNEMSVSDIRKLAIHVACRSHTTGMFIGDNDYLEWKYNVGRQEFIKRMNSLINRFPKSIKFWS